MSLAGPDPLLRGAFELCLVLAGPDPLVRGGIWILHVSFCVVVDLLRSSDSRGDLDSAFVLLYCLGLAPILQT